MNNSPLHNSRIAFGHELPKMLNTDPKKLKVSLGKKTSAIENAKELKDFFPQTFGQPIATIDRGALTKDIHIPNKVGVILSGGPAPGGHNVIAGLYDALVNINPLAKLIGFLCGPGGLVNNKSITISKSLVDKYRNTGGFDIVGSGRTKIETDQQLASALNTVKKQKLDSLVVIGGDDSNTNAVVLAEYFLAHNCNTQVIGIPKTIDGDLKNQYIETSFGFDTAAKTYAELIGNIARDSVSSRKYWHFIRLMGRSASHITLECALQTHPNVTLISEEVREQQLSLKQIVKIIANSVETRAKQDELFGVVLVPEGLIEFIPEIGALISALNEILHNVQDKLQIKRQIISSKLSLKLLDTFKSLPDQIQSQLLLDRDAHGNVQVTLIETERMLAQMVEQELKSRKSFNNLNASFNPQTHFFGYEGRCAFPSNFDSQYCYSLGYNALILISNGLTGYLSAIKNLSAPIRDWIPVGIPITMIMNLERRHGKNKPVIKKALVESNSKAFKYLLKQRKQWETTTLFRYPGSIQYFGPNEVSNATTLTLQKEFPYKTTNKSTRR